MQGNLDNQQVSAENSVFDLSVLTVLGDRQDQQDHFGFELKDREGLVAVCDGMGGLNGGKLASKLATETLLENYRQTDPVEDPCAFLTRSACQASDRVRELTDSQGAPLHAGSTMVSVLIRDHMLYWASVGDSRAYLFRGGEFVQFTLDHTYSTVLNEQRSAGVIGQEEYLRQSENAEALISYIGIDRLELIDYNQTPIGLYSEDKILIMSDGLYKLAADEEIFRIVDNFSNIGEALKALELKVQKNARHADIPRDNMTVALIRVK